MSARTYKIRYWLAMKIMPTAPLTATMAYLSNEVKSMKCVDCGAPYIRPLSPTPKSGKKIK